MSLIERLREGEPCTDAGGKAADCHSKNAESGCLCAMAADEIEQLRAALNEQWLSNHAEHCDNLLNCDSFGGKWPCNWPRPPELGAPEQSAPKDTK